MSLLDVLSLGLDAFGVGSAAKAQKQQNKLYKAQMAQSASQFAAQMDESVTRRVKDAKTAGIHPLFAMGASVGASPTITTGGTPPSGQGPASAISRMAASLGVIEQNRASAKRDEAEAQLMDSERARIEQDLRSQGSDSPGIGTTTTGGDIVLGPADYVTPRRETSQRPGVVSGTVPARIQLKDEFGKNYTLPNPEAGLDEVAQIEYVMRSMSEIPINIRQQSGKRSQIAAMEKELTRLRYARQNPGNVREFRALLSKAKRKYQALITSLKRYSR